MARRHDQIDLAYRVLDLDLVDSEGIRCGKVDDLVLSGGPGEPTYVAAIRTGPGALPDRFPMRVRRLARRLFSGEVAVVPWRVVDEFDAAVRLTERAADLGLGEGDRRLTELVERKGGR